jgi:hypothetical protein
MARAGRAPVPDRADRTASNTQGRARGPDGRRATRGRRNALRATTSRFPSEPPPFCPTGHSTSTASATQPRPGPRAPSPGPARTAGRFGSSTPRASDPSTTFGESTSTSATLTWKMTIRRTTRTEPTANRLSANQTQTALRCGSVRYAGPCASPQTRTHPITRRSERRPRLRRPADSALPYGVGSLSGEGLRTASSGAVLPLRCRRDGWCAG